MWFQANVNFNIFKVLISTATPSLRSHMCKGLAKRAIMQNICLIGLEAAGVSADWLAASSASVGLSKIGCMSSLLRVVRVIGVPGATHV